MTKDMLLDRLNNVNLRKVKSRMIKEALEQGVSIRGNHMVEYTTFFGGTVEFSYRNTPICCMFLDDMKVTTINAGEFENTPSTINQRKTIQKAVEEVRKAAGL